MSTPVLVRALPPHPNLEHERMQARKLLRAVQRGDAEALMRIRVHKPRATAAAAKLADAQFTIAREYGFASWPRMVHYIETLLRQQTGPVYRERHPLQHFESSVTSMLQRHASGNRLSGRAFAAYVPRFYGLTADEALASPVTEDDARLVVARMSGYASWAELVAGVPAERADVLDEAGSPRRSLSEAIQARDIEVLDEIVRGYPKGAQAREGDGIDWVPYAALNHEMRTGDERARQSTDWLESQGYGVQDTLNRMLLGYTHMPTSRVQWLLDRGADPNYVAPNGISALEFALVRYWNPEAVDLIAARVQPRRALWIAAGLGDVHSVSRYIDARGNPTEGAMRRRPDFAAIWRPLMPSLPIDDPVEAVWEAFFVAALNHRFAVLDLLIDRGFPVDYRGWGTTLLELAIGNRLVPLVDYLIRRGADLDALCTNIPGSTIRQAAERLFSLSPENESTRQILQLCGGDPEAS